MAPSQQAKIATTTTKAFVIVVSIKNTDTTVPAFRHHIESLLPPNVVEAFQLVKQEGQHRVSGRLILHSSIAKTKANANAFAFILRQSTCDGQSVAAQVDPTRASSVVSRSSVPSPPPQQQQQQQPEEHQPEEEEEEEKVADEEEEEEEEEEKSDEEEDNDGTLQWKKSKAVASQFFQWLGLGNFDSVQAVASADSSTSSIIDLNSVDRETVHMLFEAFFAETFATGSIIIVNNNNNNKDKDKKQRHRLESLVLAALRQQRLLKTKRYSDGIVICSFARSDRTFAPFADRKTARDKLRERRDVLTADKGGVVVSRDFSTRTTTHDSSNNNNNNNTNGGKSSSTAILPINQSAVVSYTISSSACSWQDKNSTTLTNVRLGGSHKNNFQIKTKLPCTNPKSLELSFNGARVTGAYRATVWFHFQNNNTTTTTTQQEPFVIVRSVLIRAGGDADLYEIIQPTSPYVKKKAFFEKPTNKKDIVHPPPDDSSSGNSSGHGYNKKLKMFKVPLDVREMVQSREMESALIPPTFDISDKDLINNKVYSTFWQNLLWYSELQAYEDIKLFDLHSAVLQRSGRFFKLHVAGLAEGRPSVLRGDLIISKWKGKEYRGRVYAVELLDVLVEFHESFHKRFNVSVDRVDLVRFTFSRTSFRTSHAGCLAAPKTMGARMLAPQTRHVRQIQRSQYQRRGSNNDQVSQQQQRVVPQKFAWGCHSLNEEQKKAVKEIAKGLLRPMPYCIFGPPGTGKTTTIVEAVYQLARLHKYNSKQAKLKILLVAPSNDATDILVEKLSPYFPTSEMIRIVAFTRSMDQLSPLAKPYVRENLPANQMLSEIASMQIVVTTVNMAARLFCTGQGLKKGCFDVLCVDEACHATEPEVIGAAATLMKFTGKNTGQVVLAGDPNQLGPIITSDLCKKYGLGVSFMERLIKTSPVYGMDDNRTYPSDLVTFLDLNYRSHPAILKLPNELFYDNKLIASGDHFFTHNMTKWEHLPKNRTAGFPIVFHAVDGENQREGNSPSWFNPQEAILTVETVGLLVKHSRPPIRQDEIGVITPYARQVQKIQLLLKARDMGDVKVGSVETFQGQERRCIIISTVRSENDLLQHDLKYNLGFVANEKRFNVAVTRAKALLYIIGNPRVLQTDAKNWLPLLRYCRDNKSWQGQEWDEAAAAAAEEDGNDIEEVLSGKGKDDEEDADGHGWHVVTDHEAQGFINREE